MTGQGSSGNVIAAVCSFFIPGLGQLVQGHLEASNTDVTDELSKLMRAQQAFSGSSRLLQAAADVTKRLIG